MSAKNSNSKISAYPDLAYNLLQILIQLHLIVFCVKKSNLHFSYVLKDGLLGKYLLITPKKFKIKNSLKKLLPVQKVGFQETACPENRQDGSWLSTLQLYQKARLLIW